MTPEQQKVLDFHKAMFLPYYEKPTIPNAELALSRCDLLYEELTELIEAFEDENIVKVADAIGDILYMVYGTAVTCGIDMQEIFAEIHRSNMTKIGGGLKENFKVIKPPSYRPPVLEPIIEALSQYKQILPVYMEICSTCKGERIIRVSDLEDKKTCPACKGEGKLPVTHHI